MSAEAKFTALSTEAAPAAFPLAIGDWLKLLPLLVKYGPMLAELLKALRGAGVMALATDRQLMILRKQLEVLALVAAETTNTTDDAAIALLQANEAALVWLLDWLLQ